MRAWIIIITTFLHACQAIKVDVKGKKSAPPLQGNHDSNLESQSFEPLEPRDIESYLYGIDSIRDTSPERLTERLNSNWRHSFRRDFRELRDNFYELTQKDHLYQDGLQNFDKNENQCSPLSAENLRVLPGLSESANTIEASALAFINGEQLSVINPLLVPNLDKITHLILFELGMRAKGSSQIEEKSGITYTKANVKWKVDPEIQDSPATQDSDRLSMSIQMERGLHKGRPHSFDLTITIGEGQYEGPIQGSQSQVLVKTRWIFPDSHQGTSVTQEIFLKQDENTKYARKVILEQSHRGSRVYTFTDIVFYGQAQEISKQATIDFDLSEVCEEGVNQYTVPNVIGMTKEQAELTLGLHGFNVETRTSSGPLVIQQDPKPDEAAKLKSTIFLIYGTRLDDSNNAESTTP